MGQRGVVVGCMWADHISNSQTGLQYASLVCSRPNPAQVANVKEGRWTLSATWPSKGNWQVSCNLCLPLNRQTPRSALARPSATNSGGSKIGRASCGERVCQYV